MEAFTDRATSAAYPIPSQRMCECTCAATAAADAEKIDGSDWVWYVQGEATRRREQELIKLRKDIELLTVQHESAEASLRKRHQEAINELQDQIDQLSKHRNK